MTPKGIYQLSWLVSTKNEVRWTKKATRMEPDTLTQNGENAFSTTTNANLDLFFSLVRNTEPGSLEALLKKSWTENPEITMKIICYIRDCRHGLGEKALFYYSSTWLLAHFPNLYVKNLEYFVTLGCYKDLLLMLLIKDAYVVNATGREEIDLFATVLTSENPGLASKWAPSEGGRFNRYAKELMRKMNLSAKQYRQKLSQLRKELDLIETHLCQLAVEDEEFWKKRVEQIKFSSISSQAMCKYHKALQRDSNANGIKSEARTQLAELYKKYLNDVAEGKQKINTATLMPHQIVSKALGDEDEALNVMWNDIVTKLKAKATGRLSKALAISDVSGSMTCQVAEGVTALNVSIALGILVAEVSTFADRNMITFSEHPVLAKVPQGTIHQKIKYVTDLQWDMNTDLFAVFKLLLENKIEVETVFIFTDMQFDRCMNNAYGTSFDKIKEEYRMAERKLPEIVFWNLNGSFDIKSPVQSTQTGVSLISGFSSHVLNYFLDDDELTPIRIMEKTIARYNPNVEGVRNEVGDATINWETVQKAIKHPKGSKKSGTDKNESSDESDSVTGEITDAV